MNAVFVDTGGWMACADRSDPGHVACTAARDATLEAGRLLITTDFVVDETLTLIRFRLGLAAASAWWQQIDGGRLGGPLRDHKVGLIEHSDCRPVAVRTSGQTSGR
jgi:hypothetical protein